MTISDIVKNDLWSVAEGEHEGKPLYIRFRGAFRSKPNLSAFPRLIRVVWTYAPDESGLPTDDEIDGIRDFESLLREVVEPTEIAVLVAAITNNGQREWMFYATGVPAFGQCLNEIQQDKAPYPIDVTSERDPKWSAFYEEILDAVGDVAAEIDAEVDG